MNTHAIEKEVKLYAILNRLKQGGYMTHYNRSDPYERHRIDRQILRQVIMAAIHITDQHCISAWINYLLALKVIEPNPTSEISPNGHIMPVDDTRYFLNFDNPLFNAHHTLPSFNQSVKSTLDPDTNSSSF